MQWYCDSVHASLATWSYAFQLLACTPALLPWNQKNALPDEMRPNFNVKPVGTCDVSSGFVGGPDRKDRPSGRGARVGPRRDTPRGGVIAGPNARQPINQVTEANTGVSEHHARQGKNSSRSFIKTAMLGTKCRGALHAQTGLQGGSQEIYSRVVHLLRAGFCQIFGLHLKKFGCFENPSNVALHGSHFMTDVRTFRICPQL